MKNDILKTLIFPLIVALATIFATQYINNEKADVRYSLSARIPIDDKSTESVQQLEIKNVGKSTAQNVHIKISGSILSYNVIKYSEVDVMKEIKSDKYLEIHYPEIIPQSAVRVIIRSQGEGISKNDLSILFNKGQAKEFIEKDSISLFTLIFYITIFLYFMMFIYSFRNFLSESWERKANYDPATFLKHKRRPFYVNKMKWDEFRNEALDKILTKDEYGIKIDERFCFGVLMDKKPNYIKDDEWENLINKASKQFTEIIAEQLNRSYYSQELNYLLQLERPINFKVSEWNILRDNISELYIRKRRDSYYIDKLDYVINELQLPKPEGLNQKYWDEYQKKLKEKYYELVKTQMDFTNEPIIYFQKINKEYLSIEQVGTLSNKAYRQKLNSFVPVYFTLNRAKSIVSTPKPDWLESKDYDEIIENANILIEADKTINEYNEKLVIIEKIIHGKPFPENKPELLSNDDWREYVELSNEINSIKGKEKDFLNREARIEESEEHLRKLIKKVERQLNFINTLLSNPSEVDRIEDYSVVFSKGNYVNLKKIADCLRMINLK